MKATVLSGLLASLTLALMVLAVGVVEGQQPRPGQRAEFMRLKLDYSKRVLEGLTREDYNLISKNARDLKLMSQAAEWEVPIVPKVDYLRYTAEFQRVADELIDQSLKKNLDGATLAYVQLTMNCVNCHKYVRVVER